ncbi:MAG: CAP domain-containing protein [Chitinivibrionales bacterium]
MRAGIAVRWIVYPLFLTSAILAGYGDPDPDYPTHPDWQERTVLTLVNLCRMSPEQFRDDYLQVSGILLPQNYPAVDPVYWNLNLNRIARIHAQDMAENCGLQHNSCDGTPFGSRVGGFYQGRGIAENIAYGYGSPFQTVASWILDGRSDNPAPDGASPSQQWPSGDGHRRNIMGEHYGEAGAGFALGSQGRRDENPYWVINFGSNQTTSDSKIPAGTHIVAEDQATIFMANYFSADERSALDAVVVVDGVEYPLETVVGRQWRGTYSTQVDAGAECRRYFFRFTDSGGQQHRYPEEGAFATYGEGGCEQQYLEPSHIRTEPVGVGPVMRDRISQPVHAYDVSGRRVRARGRFSGGLLIVEQHGRRSVRVELGD